MVLPKLRDSWLFIQPEVYSRVCVTAFYFTFLCDRLLEMLLSTVLNSTYCYITLKWMSYNRMLRVNHSSPLGIGIQNYYSVKALQKMYV